MSFKPHDKILVLADAHGHFKNVRAAVEYAEGANISHLWNLGDIAGLRHGAAANATWSILRERASLNLLGNHDDAAARGKVLKSYMFKDPARALPNPGYRGELSQLPAQKLIKLADGYRVYAAHASPSDPLWDFISSEKEALSAWASLDRRGIPDIGLMVVGHTHVPAIYYEQSGDSRWESENILDKVIDISAFERVILNPGSIGEDGSFMIIRLNEYVRPQEAEWKRVR